MRIGQPGLRPPRIGSRWPSDGARWTLEAAYLWSRGLNLDSMLSTLLSILPRDQFSGRNHWAGTAGMR